MKKLSLSFVAFIATTALWASNVITYKATGKLVETTDKYSSGFHTNAFNVAITSHAFSNGIGTITFAGEVTTIGERTFYECSGLTSVTIPNSITKIESYAFYGCSGLTSINIPNSVTTIGHNVFEGCSSLTSVTIGVSVTSLGYKAFHGCNNIKSVTWNARNCNGGFNLDGIFTNFFNNQVEIFIFGDYVEVIPADICSGMNKLTTISIPNSVTEIGLHAFRGCTGLTEITIGKSVTMIGGDAFRGCSGLTSVTIPNSVTTIGNSTFEGCFGLTSVAIPNSVTTIGSSAFKNCTDLTSVTIPHSVTTIGDGAFIGCTSLPVIDNLRYADTYLIGPVDKALSFYTIKEGTKWIGSNAFSYCHNLTSVTIPNSVTTIESYAFYECGGLNSVTIPNSVITIGSDAFAYCTFLMSVTIGNSVTKIGGDAFKCCSSLTSVTIPNSVTTIGGKAFEDCWDLTSVTIPNSVTTIGSYTFHNCHSLTSVTIPNSITKIYTEAFFGCSGLISLTCEAVTPPSLGDNPLNGINRSIPLYVPDGSVEAYKEAAIWKSFTNIQPITAQEVVITYSAKEKLTETTDTLTPGLHIDAFNVGIISHTFEDNRGTITFAGKITTIGDYAFAGCSDLTSVTIPNSITTIENFAFYDCSNLTSITIPNSVTTIEDYAFVGCSDLTSVIIPNSVSTIGKSTFEGCINLASVTIPNSVTTIEDFAFYECKGLTSVTIPNSVTTIGYAAFYDCTDLIYVTIPNSVTTIEDYAFVGCSDLTSVIIPNSVTTIGKDAFYMVNNIVYNGTATGSPWGAKCVNGYVDGCLVYSDATKTKLCGCSSAAAGEIIIPSSVTTIGDMAFFDCWKLASITIPNSVTTIGNDAFCDCHGLTSITIPNSVTAIGDFAFYYCYGLTSVTIPSSVTTIGSGAFYNCSDLTSMTSYAINPPICGKDCFNEVDTSIPLYVPAQSIEAYKQVEEWKAFTNIQPIAAKEIPATELVVTTDNSSVTITWPQTDDADTYTIEIKKGGDLFCTLKFNAQGQLTGIAFAPLRGGELRTMQAAEMTTSGWQFTVTGLTPGSNYNYTIDVLDASQQSIKQYTGKFTTTGGLVTDADQLNIDGVMPAKFIRNNQLQILRNGKIYNAGGEEL